MRIFTLNVNGFRGDKIGTDDFVEKDLLSNMKNLKSLVDRLIIDEEDVIILQEIPHEIFIPRSRKWKASSVYTKFLSTFSQNYKIIKPRHLIASRQCTIALCARNSLWEESEIWISNENHDYENKLVEIQYGGVSLLGVHMNPCEEMWDMLLASCKESKPTFVVGDFNAYEKRGSMKNKPQELRELAYFSCLSPNVITNHRYNSSVDNIYIAENKQMKNGFSLHVERLDFTDHALCGVEINELAS